MRWAQWQSVLTQRDKELIEVQLRAERLAGAVAFHERESAARQERLALLQGELTSATAGSQQDLARRVEEWCVSYLLSLCTPRCVCMLTQGWRWCEASWSVCATRCDVRKTRRHANGTCLCLCGAL